jgi:hypothetical protein
MSKAIHSFITALALLAGFAAPALGQISADVGPLVGYYRPLGHFDPTSVYATSLPSNPSQLRGVAWGAEGQLSFGARLGLEGRFAVANSTLPAVNTPAGIGGGKNARVSVATLQARYDVSPAPERVGVWLSAGPAFIQHGGDAYRTYGSPRSVGGAAGVGIALPVTSTLHIIAGATAVRYSFDVPMPADMRLNPGSLQHGMQTDAVIHLGVRWGRR